MKLGLTTVSHLILRWRSSYRKLKRFFGYSISDTGSGFEYQSVSTADMEPPHDEELGGEPPSKSNVERCKPCINITKWLPVLFILTIIAWSYYAFVIQLCLLTIQETWLKIFTLVVYHIILPMFLWAYWQTVFSSSGRVPRKFRIPQADMNTVETEAEIAQTLEEVVRRQQLCVATRTHIGQVRYCEKCQIVKPDRAHHCSVCGHCILKMDHHCPWVNNCVCFDNYKFFVLFVGYALLYCITIFSFTLRYFIQIWKTDWTGSSDGKFQVLMVFCVAAMFAVSLCSLLSFHCYLISKNRSTLESFLSPIFRHGPDNKEGFNLGAYNNFIEIFGYDKKKWFLPMFSSLGDGISYPTRYGMMNPLSGNYNLDDTTDSSATSESSSQYDRDQFVEVKVEARTETISELNGNTAQNGFYKRDQIPQGQTGTQLVFF